ncbi:hypothetical protein MYSTI_00679 [Myxococcus stipitatus DSM 14675]|uniref:Uncharacterized protein n=1 Tax=Myxococcus stipitatus (strain DSM 14675 / JCM 12634 / Mx s8) TaxID=1278073 RepID=L7U6E0_MYXSD|nr:hypothetical protein [Myxococcus stipitatus]AGC42029.1 hypothetical protein MYSTI_00679 [Myxococcus stipitatus DSM 14675]
MSLIDQFNNIGTRLNLLEKKPLFLSINHRPTAAWYNRTRPLATNAPFMGLTRADITAMVVAGEAAAPNNAVLLQNNITLYLDITAETQGAYGGAPVNELHAYPDNPGGALGCQYLSWEDSCIVSMELSNAGPPLMMSGPFNGCHFYVTQDTGTQQVRVHHVNANKIAEPPDVGHGQPGLSEDYMDSLLAAARRDTEAITHQMRKADYLAKVWDDARGAKVESTVTRDYRTRKEGQGRKGVALQETMCLVFGIRTAPNTWDFFFHVAGVVDYKRSGFLSNRQGYLKTILAWERM